MKRRQPSASSISFDEQPSLFDDPLADSIPVHPSIKAHAARVWGAGAGVVEPVAARPRPRDLRFISFGSGSSGNCSYVGDGDHGVLIDAGVDPRHVEQTLLANGITMDSVAGICLTHDHSDHVCSAYRLLRSYRHLSLYCTPKILGGLLRRHNISRRIKDYHVAVYKEFPFKVGPLELTAFDVSHDGTDNCGFFIKCGETTFAIATDLGCITERVDFYMRQAEYIVIEANYDAAMLRAGKYPLYLQARIMAERGHLDNVETGRFLASIVSPRLRGIYLCHLSHDNNTPELALSAVRSALLEAGVASVGDASGSLEASSCAIQLAALPRYAASPLYTFRRNQ